MQHQTTFRLSLMAAALTAVLSGCASIVPQSNADTTMSRVGDGIDSKTTNVVVRNWKEEPAQPVAYQGAALKEPAQVAPDMTMPSMPTAKAGECYARVWNEPKYDTREERRIKQAAAERIEVVPARYETVNEQVLVKEASKEYTVIPAQYETVKERVMVKPAYTKTVAVPATYDTFTEQVLVRPAYTTWKPGDNGGITKIDEATGELMCLVEVPAEYKTVSKQVLRTPASTKTIDIPAEYAEVEKSVIKTPERTVIKEIPAKYETRQVTKLVEPAKEKRVPVAAVYENVPTKVLVSDGSYEWRSVLCKTNTTEAKVTEIQQALKARGYYAGEVDGKLGPQTLNAVQAFEKDNGLPVDRFLNIDTVTALGVSPK